jgi:hypothetical protein
MQIGSRQQMHVDLFQSSALQKLAIASKALDVFIQTQGIIGSVTIFNSQDCRGQSHSLYPSLKGEKNSNIAFFIKTMPKTIK